MLNEAKELLLAGARRNFRLTVIFSNDRRKRAALGRIYKYTDITAHDRFEK